MNHKTDLQRENNLQLKYGFQFTDLFKSQKLNELADAFYKFYERESPAEYAEFAKYSDAKGAGYLHRGPAQRPPTEKRHDHRPQAELSRFEINPVRR